MDVKLLMLLLGVVGAMIAAMITQSGYFELNRIVQIVFVGFLLPVIFRFHWKIYVIFKTLPRDIKFFYHYIYSVYELKGYARDNMTVMKIFRERVKCYPEKPCLIFEGRVWTNADINKYSNQVASIFQKAGYVKGDVVALMMTNRPEYIAIWLGLGKLGVITALINTNLRLQSLVHCIHVAKAKGIIYVEEYSSAINEITESISGVTRYEKCSDAETLPDNVRNFNKLISEANTEEPVVENEPGYRDRLLYNYTSGTTGLPKVAIVPNSRYLLAAVAAYNMIGLRPDDILYNPNPLYHISGGVMGTSCALTKGIPTVLRTKFSVTSYWIDCIKYKCTVAQYIGEMCRYLLKAPSRPEETQHSLRLMVGNGMRPQIWRNFMERFKIKQIIEVYGSSEGNTNILNVDNQIGAVGFIPSILPTRFHPVGLIRVNPETHQPIRNADGLCIRVEINEPGMFVGLIKEGDASREFNGYLDKEASRKKIIENVFTKGDKAFSSGDILVQDEYGYLYFKDRVGDTFRWKGENVAAAEVEAIINKIVGQRDVIVYGVQIPGTEGRAGMAAIVDRENLLDFKALAEGLDKALPSYARPIFLRTVKELELTGTWKLKKINLQKEGFDPTKIQDKLYFRSGSEGYVEITPELYQEIISGSKKL